MIKKRMIVFVLILMLLTSCSTDGVKVNSIERHEQKEIEKYNVKINKDDYTEYFYVLKDGAELKDRHDNLIHKLNLKERLFKIEEKDYTYYVKDRYGNKGYVKKDLVTKDFTSDIQKKYPNVLYDVFSKKEFIIKNNKNVYGLYFPNSKIDEVDKFLKNIENTKINTLVINYKDDSGNILFPSKVSKNVLGNKNYLVSDYKKFMKKFKDKNIRLIARIVVFKSPKYSDKYEQSTIKKNGKPFILDGVKWTSPYDRKMWEYIYELSREAVDYGFDEIQYDYVRFPATDLNGLDLNNKNKENKVEVIQKFLVGAKSSLADKNVNISADVFGWSTTSNDDINIGQQWESVSNVVDIISPMIYPQAYSKGVYGLDSPVKHPYKVVNTAIKDAKKKDLNIKSPAIIRPWIQDYSLGYEYGQKEVDEEIKAVLENNVGGFLIWNINGEYHLDSQYLRK